MSLGLYWTYWRQLDSGMVVQRESEGGDADCYGAEMEREWRGWETAAFVFRSLERLGRNESGSSVQDSLMLLQTIRFTYLYPKIDQRPRTLFTTVLPENASFLLFSWMCDAFNEKEPAATLDACARSIDIPLGKKVEVSRGNVIHKQICFSSCSLFFKLLFNYKVGDTFIVRRLLFV